MFIVTVIIVLKEIINNGLPSFPPAFFSLTHQPKHKPSILDLYICAVTHPLMMSHLLRCHGSRHGNQCLGSCSGNESDSDKEAKGVNIDSCV